MQLASSLPGLSGSPSPEMLKALQYNPLLYYSYYAQMLTALQAQQKILDMNTGNPSSNNNNNSSANSIKDILSPVKLGKDSNQVSDWQLIRYFWFVGTYLHRVLLVLSTAALRCAITCHIEKTTSSAPWCTNCLRVKFSQLRKKARGVSQEPCLSLQQTG